MGCDSEADYSAQKLQSTQTFKVDLSQTAGEVILSSLADEHFWLPLQRGGDPSSLVGSIYRIRFTKDHIFVFDYFNLNQLQCFDKKGNFISLVGKPGRGPGEYAQMVDFAVLPDERQVIVLDGAGKAIYFGFDGKHLRTKALQGFSAASLEPVQNGFMATGGRQDADFLHLDQDLNLRSEKFPYTVRELNVQLIDPVFSNPVSGENLILRYLDNSIYSITDTSLFVKYNIDFLAHTPSVSLVLEEGLTGEAFRQYEREKAIILCAYKMKEIIFLRVIKGNEIYWVFLEVDTGQSRVIRKDQVVDDLIFGAGGIVAGYDPYTNSLVLKINPLALKKKVAEYSQNRPNAQLPFPLNSIGEDSNPLFLCLTISPTSLAGIPGPGHTSR